MKTACWLSRYKLFLYLSILFFLYGGHATAQTASIGRGLVKDIETEESLPGVLIQVKGSEKGAITDIDGRFELQVKNGDVLLFSLLGYQTEEFLFSGQKEIALFLKPSSYELSELIVTALGIEKEAKTLSYAAQQISGEDVRTIRDNSSNILSSLSGKVAGAVITTAASGPGSAARIVLRGNRSISGSNSALLVIDGVPYDNSSLGQATGTSPSYGSSDGAVNINPDDVETINVLKGPSAAALYGSRAANGAIVITTKQGKSGRFSIDYNGGVSFEQPYLLMQLQNEYGRGNGGKAAEGVGESWGSKAQTYKNNVKDFFNTALSYNNSISFFGGTKQIQGYASLTNNSVEGIVPGNKLSRNTINARVNTNFYPKLTTDTKLTYVNQKIDNKPRLGDAGTPLEAYIMPRDMSKEELKDFETINPSNGQPVRKYWTTSSIYDNPYWSTERTSVNEERSRITALFTAKYQLTDWLSVMGRMSYDRYNDKQTGSFYDGTVSLGNVRAGGMYYETYTEAAERNFDFLISGENKILESLSINYNLGASALKRTYSMVQNMANGLSIPNHFTLASASNPSFEKIENLDRKLNSIYASVQLEYAKFLYLEMTARNDWSSTLPTPHSYFYPSVGLSAILSEIIAMPQWIDFAKVRTSYTQVGNDAEPYLLQQRYKYSLGAGKGFVLRDQFKSIGDLKPEKTKSFEVGVDWRFFGGRLSLDATYYKSNTINQLLFVGLPMASGFNRRYINAGDVENKGIEITVAGKPVELKDFSWETSINFSTNKNKVKELAPNTTQVNITENTKYATVIVKEGSSYGDLYGYKWKRNEKGMFVVDDRGLPIVEPNQKLGNYNPDFMLGFTNTLKYKNYTLSFLIDGRIGGEMVSGTDAYLAAYGLNKGTLPYREGGFILDAVKSDGTKNSQEITSQQLWTTVSQNGRDAWGEFFTYDMTNFRMRELSLGYDHRFTNGSVIKSMQVSVIGRNLFFFYRGKSKLNIPGIGKRKNPTDAEAALGAGNYQGVELGLPPITRTFGFNVKLSF